MKKKLFKTLLLASFLTLGAASVDAQQLDRSQLTKVLHNGQVKLTLLADGNYPGESKIIKNASQAQLDKYLPNGAFTSAVNAFLITTPERKMLVDTGYGKEIFKNLEYLGIQPSEIDTILLTHMHPDHINGLARDGAIAFPNAELYVAQKEYAYWQDKDAAKMLEPYAGRIKLIEPGLMADHGVEILPGIAAIAAYGHTPGHTMFLLRDGGQSILIWGDITHVTPIQIPLPEIYVSYDIDPTLAVATREQVLAYSQQNNLTVTGAHIEYPALFQLQTVNGIYQHTFVK